MRKFSFRLQKVLEYREAMEQMAQDAYLDTRVARLEAEAVLHQIESRRGEAVRKVADSLDGRRHLEMILQTLDDEELAQKSVIEVLATEEEKALQVWQEKKRELETIVKLKEKAKAEWDIEATRHEQAELDEWSVLRRGA